jgi:hypothetical protein
MHAALPFAVSAADGTVIGASITAVLAATVAIYLNAVGRKREDRNRRRDIYSQAYRTALEWCEAVHRVRRRAADGSEDRALVEQFHQLQERIAYYQGWLCIEAADLGRSYESFLDKVLAECRPLLQEAWSKPGREPTEPPPSDERAPDLSEAKTTYLREVRKHLSPWWESQ